MSGLAVEKPGKDFFQDDKPEADQHERDGHLLVLAPLVS
jgi:hypothetical protein